MSKVNSSNYSTYSPLMEWATADSDQFNRTDVSNTAQTLEQHVHGGAAQGTGLSVLNLNSSASTNTALAHPGDVLIASSTFTYRDGSGNNHTLAQLDGTNTYAANGVQNFSAQTGANSFLIPVIAGAAPTTSGALAYDSTANVLKVGSNGTTINISTGATGTMSVAAFGTTDPTNGLLCDGRAISRTTYSNLFSKIGTAYGAGDGSTTFNIPDGRSRIFMGADNMGTSAGAASRTSSNNALGNTSGEDTHTLTTAELAVHSHSHNHGSHSHGSADGNNFYTDAATTGFTGSGTNNIGTATSSTGSTTLSTDATTAGSGSAHNNRQLTQVANWVIWV